MHTEIAIGDLQQLLEVVEAEDFIYRQRTHDGQADALVNQRIEFQALCWLSGNFAGASASNCGNASCAIGVGLGHNGLPKINVLQKISSVKAATSVIPGTTSLLALRAGFFQSAVKRKINPVISTRTI